MSLPDLAANPADSALLQDMTRTRAVAGGWVVEVAVVSWPHPHTPCTRWEAVAHLPAPSSDALLSAARRQALYDRRFFTVCHACGLRHASGQMLPAGLCMACAESQHGVIF